MGQNIPSLPHRIPAMELGRPRESLVEIVESESIKPCRTLDLCCGAGINPIYFAKQEFDVGAMDVSDGAV
jgi:methylase of polypeptide subunit release factors